MLVGKMEIVKFYLVELLELNKARTTASVYKLCNKLSINGVGGDAAVVGS